MSSWLPEMQADHPDQGVSVPMVETFAVLNLQPSVDKSEHVCTPPPSLLLSHQDRECLRQVCLLHLDAHLFCLVLILWSLTACIRE